MGTKRNGACDHACAGDCWLLGCARPLCLEMRYACRCVLHAPSAFQPTAILSVACMSHLISCMQWWGAGRHVPYNGGELGPGGKALFANACSQKRGECVKQLVGLVPFPTDSFCSVLCPVHSQLIPIAALLHVTNPCMQGWPNWRCNNSAWTTLVAPPSGDPLVYPPPFQRSWACSVARTASSSRRRAHLPQRSASTCNSSATPT